MLVPGAAGPLVVPPMAGATPSSGELVGPGTGAGVVSAGPSAGGTVVVVDDG